MGDSPRASHRGILLSIVNEYDLVSRTDGAYALSLINLYRSIYSLPSIQDDDSRHRQNFPIPQLPRFGFDTKIAEINQLPVWPLPQPEYWHLGQIVVFKVKVAETIVDDSLDGGKDELVLHTVAVSPEEFGKLLFCDVSSHRRISYQERVDLLREGCFNGKKAWD
jgi:hypothetical protein